MECEMGPKPVRLMAVSRTIAWFLCLIQQLMESHVHVQQPWAVKWWCHDMEMICTLLAICEGNPPITGRFTSQRATNVELWCCKLNQSVEQSVKLLVISDTLSCMWHLILKLHGTCMMEHVWCHWPIITWNPVGCSQRCSNWCSGTEASYTELELHHNWKLSKWQLMVQPVMTNLST